MLNFTPAGAIFDLDDTLLDNEYSVGRVGLHERLRLEAVHAIGVEREIPELLQATLEQSVAAFRDAKVTSFEYALWGMLCLLGVRHNPDEPDPTDELMIEITKRKNHTYQHVLKTTIREVSGSSDFVRNIDKQVSGKLAIGSSAKRQDIITYLETKKLVPLFSEERIISIESVVHPKPHPEVYNKAFTSLKLPEVLRKNVCVFEDDPRGVMAAKSAGMFACAITTRHTRREFEELMVPPDLIADSYDEFNALFDFTSIENPRSI